MIIKLIEYWYNLEIEKKYITFDARIKIGKVQVQRQFLKRHTVNLIKN